MNDDESSTSDSSAINDNATASTEMVMTSLSRSVHVDTDEPTVSAVTFALTVAAMGAAFIATVVILVVYFRKQLIEKQSSHPVVQYTKANTDDYPNYSDVIQTEDGTMYIAMDTQPDIDDSGKNGPKNGSYANIPEYVEFRPESFKNRIKFFWKRETVKEEANQHPPYANIDVHKNATKNAGVKRNVKASNASPGAANPAGVYYSVNALLNHKHVNKSRDNENQNLYENT